MAHFQDLEYVRMRHVFQHHDPIASAQDFSAIRFVPRKVAVHQDESDILARCSPQLFYCLRHLIEAVIGNEDSDGANSLSMS